MNKVSRLLVVVIITAAAFAVAFPLCAETVESLGRPTGFVNDYADVILSSDEAQLNTISQELKNANTAEMAIVTINSLDGKSVEEFAQELFTKWGIGQASSDNGVLILMSINDRDWRVQTGYGVEGVLTDSLARRIMENEAVPEFRNGNYGLGLINAAGAMKSVIEGEEYTSGGLGVNFGVVLGVLFFPVIIVAVAVILIWLAVRIKCPRCGSRVKCTSNKEVLESDYSHSGIRKSDYECTVCHHVFSRMVIIPMLVESTSSGGGGRSSGGWFSSGSSGGGGGGGFGGFSGGSSGGGGASGGW